MRLQYLHSAPKILRLKKRLIALIYHDRQVEKNLIPILFYDALYANCNKPQMTRWHKPKRKINKWNDDHCDEMFYHQKIHKLFKVLFFLFLFFIILILIIDFGGSQNKPRNNIKVK